MSDGRVEALIFGQPAAVQALIDWLWHGPPGAHVTNVEVSVAALETPPQDFAIR